jgi:hypothetical protein
LEQARYHLEKAERLVPNALGASLSIAALEVEDKNYSDARRLAIKSARRSPKQIQLWLLVASTALIATPRQGRIIVPFIAFATFLPYLETVLYSSRVIFAVACFIALRRISPRLALLSILYLFSISLGYLARYSIYGGFFSVVRCSTSLRKH